MLKGKASKKNTHLKLCFLYAVILFLSLVIYPHWFLPTTLEGRLFLFTVSISWTALSSLIFYKLVYKLRFKSETIESGNIRLLGLLLIIFIAIHSFFLLQPLTPPGDEGHIVARGTFVYRPLRLLVMRIFNTLGVGMTYESAGILISIISVVLIALLIKLLLFLKKRHINYKNIFKTKSSIFLICVSCIFFLYVYFFLLNHIITLVNIMYFGSSEIGWSHIAWLVRFPPFSTYSVLIPHLLFGYNLFFIRLVQCIMMFFSAYFVFRILRLYLSGFISFIFSCIYAFVPVIFYYSHLNYLTGGVMLLFAATSYFTIKYVQEEDNIFAVFLFLVALVGFLYKDPLVFIFPIVLVSTFIYHYYTIYLESKNILTMAKTRFFLAFFKKHKLLILLFLLFIPTMILWTFMKTKYTYNNYFEDIDFSVLTNSGYLTRYFPYLPLLAGRIIFALFIVGIVVSLFVLLTKLIREKQLAFGTIYFSVFFIIIYLVVTLFTSLNFPVTFRIISPIAIPIIFFSAFCFYPISRLTGKLRFLPYLLLFTILIFTAVPTLKLDYETMDERYLPYDPAYNYLSDEIKSGKILYLDTEDYYTMLKFNVENEAFLKRDYLSFVNKNSLKQNASNLIQFMKKNNISYVLYPNLIPAQDSLIFYKDWDLIWCCSNNESLKNEIYTGVIIEIDSMIMNKKEFVLIERFRYGKNILTLARLEE